jgi:transitional endoplasmic reticulum ATPase
MKKIIKNIVPTSCKECKFYYEGKYVTSKKEFISKKDYVYKNVIVKERYCGKSNDPQGKLLSLNTCLFFKPSAKTIDIIEKQNKNIESKKPRIKSGNGFSDIAGMDSLKKTLTLEVLDVLKRPEHYKKYGVTIPNGMLLYGPPGCGKSFISEKFCEEAGFNFFMVKPSDLSSIYVSGGEEKIGQLFQQAEANSPTVICFDEVDAVMPKRSDDSNHSISARVNEFLTQINKCSDRGIFVIATTNKPNLIDTAMLRTGRLEIKVYVPPPDSQARADLFKIYLKNRYKDENIDFVGLSKESENYVASDVEYVVNKAAHSAAINEVKISMDILREVMRNFKPSINKDILQSYEQDHEKFSGSKDEPNSRSPIGFKRY